MMTEDEQVARIMLRWGAPGNDPYALKMARDAVAAVNGPREWGPGEDIPPDVTAVGSRQGLMWVRDTVPPGVPGWICYVGTGSLQDRVGTVTEVKSDPTNPIVKDAPEPQEDCPECGGPSRAGAEPDGLQCWECDLGWVRGDKQCGAGLPEYGFTCTRHETHTGRFPIDPADKSTWHYDRDTGHYWDGKGHDTTAHPDAALSAGNGAGGVQEDGADSSADGVVLKPQAVTEVVELLDAAASRLRRLKAAYKGAATKHAGDIANGCERSAELLRSLISDGKEAEARA